MIVGSIMFAALIVLLLCGMPIAAGLGLIGIVVLFMIDPALLQSAAYTIWSNSTSFTLSCVPLFIMLGELIVRSGLSVKFYRALSLWVRWLPGKLLHTNIAATALFAAISGSSVATAAAIGSVAIPEFKALGYRKSMVYGTLAAGGTLGILIPPSLGFIIYGGLIGDSIGDLFIAGIVPGIIMTLIFMAYIAVRATLDPSIVPVSDVNESKNTSFKDILISLRDVSPILLIMIAMMGGLYLGVATPTESAAVGVVLALVVIAAYGKWSWSDLLDSTINSARTTGMVLFVILGAQVFSIALYKAGATTEIASLIMGLGLDRYGVWAVIIIFYLFLGMFVDSISMVVLTLMFVHPIMINLGFDSIWFGVMLVILCEIGLITPPVGMNLYTIQAIAKEPKIGEIVKGSLPFVALFLVGIVIFTIWPQIVLWLPQSMAVTR